VAELEAAAPSATPTSTVDAEALAALREERDALRAERAGLVSDRDLLAAERDTLQAELESVRGTAAEEIAAAASAMEEAETDDSVTVIPVGDEPAPPPPAVVPGRAVIVVLDGQGTWAAQTLPHHQVIALRPDLSVRDHVATVQPDRLIVNLAVPGSLQALAALRANGCMTRAWGCFVEPGAERGLVLGLVEPAIAPLDPDAVIDALGDYAVRGARVMTTGVDVDGLMSVRQALSRRRVSVSMAWDRKQAGELLSVVKPHAVLIDLDLPRDDGYGILCELASAEPVPFAVILGSHDASSPSLESLMAGTRSAGPVVGMRDVLNTLSTRPPRPTPDEELRSKRRGPSRGC
jgi:CheY-like chemotaxis protein